MGEGTEVADPGPIVANGQPGTTTTISTIAVRAEPHSTVVVAILKSIGYVELRIDEMNPGLLQIGANPSENAQLLLIHDDLYQRLLNKQQQVEELLGRAEKLVQEQTAPDDVQVYEAMADGLAAAWKGLNRQLAMRGYILSDTQRLYETALKHEELAKLAKSRLLNVMEHDAQITMPEIQRIIEELAELTRAGLEIGSGVIGQIRLLGTLADNAQRPREAFDACLAIEKIMLRLAESWEVVEGAWREQREIVQHHQQKNGAQIQAQVIKQAEIDAEDARKTEIDQIGRINLEAAEHWLLAARKRFYEIRDADDPATTDADEEEMELRVLVNEIKANQASLKTLSERHPQASNEQLLELYNRFLKEVQEREELLARTRAMLTNADTLLMQLDKMRADLHQASAAMAGELGPLAQQKGVALIEEGTQLEAQWHAEPAGGSVREWAMRAVRTRADALKEAVIEVVQQARERIAAGRVDKLRDKLSTLEHWLHSVAGPGLAQPIDLGPGAAETSEFLGRHRRFSTDLTQKEQELRSLIAAQQKAEHLVPAEEARLDAVHAGMGRVRQMVEARVQLAQHLEQLQKLCRELDTSLHFLGTLVAQNGDDCTNVEGTLQQMRNLLQQANEHIYRERHQVEKFASLISSASGTDPNLGLQPALSWARGKLSAHEQELKRLQAQCVQWEARSARPKTAPQIVVGLPAEQCVLPGLRLELSARVQGQPEPNISWFKDDTALTECTTAGHCRTQWHDGTATLQIDAVRADDAGLYALRARNAVGQAESECRLRVEHAEALMSNKARVVDQVRQPTEPGQQTTVIPTTITSATRFETEEGGEVAGQLDSKPCKPRFERQLVNASVPQGAPFTLDCVVVGHPEPKIIWYREEQTVRESDRVHLAFRGDHCTLTCSDARTEDSGLYKVLAVNAHGETMNFCRVCIVPPSPKRAKVPPPTPPKPATPILARRVSIPDEMPVEQPDVIPEELSPKTAQPPSIEPQLCSQLVREGQSVHFQVHIDGVPEPEVRWFFNQNPIIAELREDLVIGMRPEDNTHYLNIPSVALEHAGQYTVEAKNAHGELRSMATLNVLLGVEEGAMMMETMTTTSPSSGIMDMATPLGGAGFDSPLQHLGQQSHFQPPYLANSMGDHQSYFAEQRHTAITDQMVDQRSWSQQSGPSPQGIVYAVSRSERAESRRSSDQDPGYSSLANAPEFIRPFQQEVTINEGETTEVDCLMVGNPRPKVQWFFNDRPIKSSPYFVEFSNVGDTYTIRFPGARLECAGHYRLVAENTRGRAEARTLVYVRPRALIAKPLQRRSLGGSAAERGVQALLRMQRERQLAQQQKRAMSTPPRTAAATTPSSTCTISTASPLLLQYPATADGTTALSMSGYQQSAWVQQPPNREQIVAVPPNIADERCARLQLLMTDAQQIRHRTPPQPQGFPPHFVQTLASVVVAQGQPAKFEAQVTGQPEPRVDWSKDGQPLVESVNVQCSVQQGHALLQVQSAGPAEAGKYCCTAENQFGMASSSAQLVLRPKTVAPDFVCRLISEEVEEGMPLKWTVRISGEPEPAISWLRDGQPIEDGQGGVRLVQIEPFVYSLLIGAVMVADAGQFTCVLTNSAGEARSTADLVVRRKGTAPGKYVHVAKVSQERQMRGEEIAQCETVVVEGASVTTPSVDDEQTLSIEDGGKETQT